jgi:hypothetical protein
MRRPKSNSLLAWTGAAIEDLADSVERLNHDLGQRENDPKWVRRTFNNSWDIVSLRRWSFIFPGGGALRGGRPPKPIPPATRGGQGTLAKSQAERVARAERAAKQAKPASTVTPPVPAASPKVAPAANNKGRVVSEI